jgi:hypothetical protein
MMISASSRAFVKKQAQERDHRGSAYLISHVTPARIEYSVRTAILDLVSNVACWHPPRSGCIHGKAFTADQPRRNAIFNLCLPKILSRRLIAVQSGKLRTE